MILTASLISWFLDIIVKTARRPILIAIVTLIFAAIAAVSLMLSGIIFKGWWQGFFQALGVGLLLAGIVDVAILGALRGLIEGETQPQEMIDYLQNEILKAGSTSTSTSALQAALDLVREDEMAVTLIMQGAVQDLASQITMRQDKPDDADIEATWKIAVSLASSALEIAIHSTDPQPFRRMLLARLEGTATTEATEFNMGLRELHADLASRFRILTDQLDSVLDRLPSPALAPDSSSEASVAG